MILRVKTFGMSAAGLLAAGLLAANAGPAPVPEAAPAARADAQAGEVRKVVKVHVVKAGDMTGAGGEKTTKLVIDGEEVAADVEKTVEEAVAEAMKALEDLDGEISVEVDGQRIEELSEKHRETLARVRERLKDMSGRIAADMADVEVRVAKAGEKAGAARKTGEAMREKRVIVLRDGADEARIEIDTDKDGRTVVIIKGGDVKVMTGDKDKDAGAKTDKPKTWKK